MHADSSIPDFVTAAINHGNQLIAAGEREDVDNAARRRADELAEIAEAWRPVLATINQATPEWVQEYIFLASNSKPTFIDTYFDSYRLPAVIDLSTLLADVPTIRVWAKPHERNPSILFEPGRYSLVHDDESGWGVMTRFDNYKVTDNDLNYFYPGTDGATDNFHVALAQAVADRTDLAALQAEAERLNAMPTFVSFEASVPPAPINPLERIANYLERVAALYEQHHKF